MILWLLACTTVEPAQVLEAVDRGDLDLATALVEQTEEPELAPLREGLRRWQTVAPQREAVASASREILQASVQERIAAGDLDGAAAPLAAALLAWPQDPSFLGLAEQLGTAAEQAPRDEAVLAWQALAELFDAEPARARVWADRAARAQLEGAYAPQALADTRAGQAGLRRAAVDQLLAQVDREYVDAPDWARLSAGGRQRMAWLAQTAGALQAWPRLADATWPEPRATDLAGARADLDAMGAAAAAAGLPEEVLLDVWVGGALAALDPWTRAVWPAEIASWEAHHAGVEVGVGLELELSPEGEVRVLRPLPDSPAWGSGIHQDDVLLSIRGEEAVVLEELPGDRRLAAAQRALGGAPGTAVDLRWRRDGAEAEARVLRAPVVMETVEGYTRGPDNAWSPWLDAEAGIAYVRISAFRDSSEAAFDALVEPALGSIGALVLDLRDNPGGDIDAAVQIADRFVTGGQLVGVAGRVLPETGPSVDPATGAPLAAWNEALAGHALEGTPLVVLVDGGTASAAEVLAGAVQELGGAVVVGSPSFGKGLAQALRAEPELGYALQLTNLAWTLPGGRRLSRKESGRIQPQLRLPAASPGEAFHIDWMRAQRGALRAHADGSPMHPVGAGVRQDLPPLDEDPVLLVGELLARARLVEVPSTGP